MIKQDFVINAEARYRLLKAEGRQWEGQMRCREADIRHKMEMRPQLLLGVRSQGKAPWPRC